MFKFKYFLLTALMLAQYFSAVVPAWASFDPGRIKYSYLTMKQGLSKNAITCLFQDRTGYMWIGTIDGLNKYDGYTMTVYKRDKNNAASLTNNYIRTIAEDKDGRIWVGTSNGLDRLDPITESFTHYAAVDSLPFSLSGNSVWTTYADRAGRMWVGTDMGLNLYDPDKDRFFHYKKEPLNPNSLCNDEVFTIFEDSSGALWVGTANGLNRLSLQNEGNPPVFHFAHYKYDGQPFALSSNKVLTIFEDAARNLWIGTQGGGLNRYNPESDNFAHYFADANNPNSLSSNSVVGICQDRPGYLWIAANNGLNIFDTERNRFYHLQQRVDSSSEVGLSSERILCFLTDQSGLIWVGTYGGGITILNQSEIQFGHFRPQAGNRNSLVDGTVWSIFEDSAHKLWVGTDKGLSHTDSLREKFTHFRDSATDQNALSLESVLAMTEDKYGTLWVGTYTGGLSRYLPDENRVISYSYDPLDANGLNSNLIRALYRDRADEVWVGTSGGGLNRFTPNPPKAKSATTHFVSYKFDPKDAASLSNNSVWCILQDRAGMMWIGTYGGLNRLDPKTGQCVRYQNDPHSPGSLSNNSVWSLAEDLNGRIWAGTDDGLNCYDPKIDRFYVYTTDDGLPDNVIRGILGDARGNLWISTTKGLCSFDQTSGRVRLFDTADGIQDPEFNPGACFKSADGEMFFGGINGFNMFYPDQIKEDTFAPPVVITAFKIFDRHVPFDYATLAQNPIKLNYDENFISFEFAALDYHDPVRNQYTYRLDGFDKNWVDAGNRHYVSYTNLAPGTYLFRVRGSNADGFWNEEGAAVAIQVVAPFWMAWWVRLLTVSAALGFVFIAYRGWLVNSQKRRLELQIADRTRDLQEKTEELQLKAQELAESNQRITVFSEIGQKITSALDLEKMLMFVFKNINAMMEASIFGIGFYDEAENCLDYRLFIQNGRRENNLIIDLTDRLYFESYCIQHRDAVFIGDLENEAVKYIRAPRFAYPDSRRPQSLIFLPLILTPRVIGLLTVQSYRKDAYSPYHLSILKSLASYTAIAMDNSTAYEKLNRLNEVVTSEKQKISQAHQELKAAQNQLIQAEKMASLGQLTAGIAHEIKNPLNFVNNFAEISKDLCAELHDALKLPPEDDADNNNTGALSAEATELLQNLTLNMEKIVEHGRRADNIVKGMLLHARSAGQERVAIDLNGLIDQYTRLAYHGFRARYPSFQVIIHTVFDVLIPPFFAVPQDLSRVILNIVDNGCYAVHVKKERLKDNYNPQIWVQSRHAQESVEILFRDNGDGIPVENQRKIFEPFYTTKPTGSGSGLGLSICYDIVVNGHGGSLTVNSHVGEATEICLKLPKQPVS